MIESNNLEKQLETLNRRLSTFTNPAKNMWWNFYSGIFRSLGSLFGTVVVAAIIVYILAQLNLLSLLKSLIPTNFSVPLSPGQL